jgi:CubicO group peptidase (beta-lactamase class C family)
MLPLLAILVLPTSFSGPLDPRNQRLAAEYSAAKRGISMLVMVDGKVAFEDYPNGGRPDRAHELASGTKSFVGAMALAAEEDGLLRLDEKASDTLTEWRGDPKKAAVTIRQILNLTSGLPGGSAGRPAPYVDSIAHDLIDEPGKRFRYGAVPFQTFGEIMRRKLTNRGEGPLDYLDRRIFKPIGLRCAFWRKGRDGNPHLPSGAHLTAREWAKYGELVRLGGVWNGKRVLDAKQLEDCFVGTPANPAYGLTWWMNRPVDPTLRRSIPQLNRGSDEMWSVDGIPKDLVFAAGAGYQRLYVSRSARMVVVRQAEGILDVRNGGGRSGYSDRDFLSRLMVGKGGS